MAERVYRTCVAQFERSEVGRDHCELAKKKEPWMRRAPMAQLAAREGRRRTQSLMSIRIFKWLPSGSRRALMPSAIAPSVKPSLSPPCELESGQRRSVA